MNKKKIRVIFFSFRPYINASSRYRIFKIANKLNKERFSYKILTPFSNRFYIKLISSKNPLTFFNIQIITLLKRIFQLFYIHGSQIIIIQRELLRIGPPLLEKLISKINSNIIFDIDDADYHLRGIFYDHNKFKKIIKLSKVILVGNSYLENYAKKYNKIVRVIPTLIDTERYLIKNIKKRNPEQKFIIGWVGTPNSLKNLKLIESPLKVLIENLPIEFYIISNKNIELKGIPVNLIKWNINSEIKKLKKLDLGIMPLYDTQYNRGKCGFKLIQYMALGIPTVSSPVGVNKKIIHHGIDGFLAKSANDWIKYIELLINNYGLYSEIHKKSRKKIVDSYSYKKYIPIIERIIKKLFSISFNM